MTRTVVDTSALIALLYPDDRHNRRAVSLLQAAAADGAISINPVVYAELAADPYFESHEQLDAFLDDTGIGIEELPHDALFHAGEAFQTYLDRRGDGLQCGECGHQTTYECGGCGAPVTARQHVPADFLIGAHAETADELVTFDRGFYRDYFDVECRTVRE
ncbi:type II toxin-antitoxin system VapC family toxin [Halorussus sp. MSC15.2]|uniref:type II toxin-antitoxin system VapC family toxin n=1 Tax=Halorussus sp. MSC15.2 TaxID=2283638 RepID=UPI0013D1666F|nr:type II toxin-antitoxin system VapC family toxin [Halorussus sp. MSC15.2]NEU55746.1 type II toxin-antitoxin system VapC family toxin [Halorussus sp. MSC15.2]